MVRSGVCTWGNCCARLVTDDGASAALACDARTASFTVWRLHLVDRVNCRGINVKSKATYISSLLAMVCCLAAGLSAQQPPSEETIAYFEQNCQQCHTIGGGVLTGPDLKDVTKRRDKAWLTKFIRNPKAIMDSGDPYARKLLKDFKGQIMPALPGLTADRAGKLVDLIAAESKLEKSRFAKTLVSDRPLTPEDIVVGRELFIGTTPFERDAPACISCHTTLDVQGFGGGMLGPDLSTAYARLEGRKALAAWLTKPPSLVMAPVFKGHDLQEDEILGLVAYMKSVAEQGATEAESKTLEFLLAGIGSAALLLLSFDYFWRRRYRAVRRPLVSRE